MKAWALAIIATFAAAGAARAEVTMKWDGKPGGTVDFLRGGKRLARAVMNPGKDESHFFIDDLEGDLPAVPVVVRYRTGKVKEVWNHSAQSGRAHFCTAKRFFPDGKVQYDSGLPTNSCDADRTAREYFDTGGLKVEMPYRDGAVNGVSRIYKRDGALDSEAAYSADSLTLMKVYHPDGKLKISTSFKGGVPDGPVKSYHENGSLDSEGMFVQGRYEGDFKEFYEDGVRLKRHAVFREGEQLHEWLYDRGGRVTKYTASPR